MSWTEIVELAKSLAAVIGCGTIIATLLIKLSKPIRNKVNKWIKSTSKTDEQQVKLDTLSSKIDELTNMLSVHITEDYKFKEIMLDSIEKLKSGSAIALGDVIRGIYCCYRDEEKIPEKEFQIVKKAYDLYHDDFGFNGPVEYMFNKIKSWELIITE